MSEKVVQGQGHEHQGHKGKGQMQYFYFQPTFQGQGHRIKVKVIGTLSFLPHRLAGGVTHGHFNFFMI